MVSRWSIPSSRRNLIPWYGPLYKDARLSRCESCHREFGNKNDLKHHVLLTHTGKKPHTCVIFGKRYRQLHHLESHFKLHREPRLQEFAILKHGYKLSQSASPLQTTVGSFRVPKALKSYVSEPTFKSYGTLQSFTITQLNKPEPDDMASTKDNFRIRKSDSSDVSEGINMKLRNQGTRTSAHSKYINLPEIKSARGSPTRDNATQTASTRVTSRNNVLPTKDYWVDTKSEWHSQGTLETSTSLNSLYSQPISFKASTPKEPRFFDDPDSVSRGMSGIESSSGYDPVFYQKRRKCKQTRNKKSIHANQPDSDCSIDISIYEN